MNSSQKFRIIDSARKRGFSDPDIFHALRHFLIEHSDQGDHHITVFVGPAQDGTLLEVGVIEDKEEDRVIHAMRVRPKYLPRSPR